MVNHDRSLQILSQQISIELILCLITPKSNLGYTTHSSLSNQIKSTQGRIQTNLNQSTI